jgi:hypothetical protein
MSLFEPRMLPRTPIKSTICMECKKPLTKAEIDGDDAPLCDPCLTFICQEQRD